MDELNGQGDCFIAAVKLQERLVTEGVPEDELVIVHGVPFGRGGDAEGRRFWHAWVERARRLRVPVNLDDGPDSEFMEVDLVEVMDHSNGLEVDVPAAIYYQLGDIHQTWRFTPAEATAAMANHGHFGPWVDGWEDMGFA